jgi:hypothetical protein
MRSEVLSWVLWEMNTLVKQNAVLLDILVPHVVMDLPVVRLYGHIQRGVVRDCLEGPLEKLSRGLVAIISLQIWHISTLPGSFMFPDHI